MNNLAIIIGIAVTILMAGQTFQNWHAKSIVERDWETALEICHGHARHDGQFFRCVEGE